MADGQSDSSLSSSESRTGETQDKYKFAFLIVGFVFMNSYIIYFSSSVNSRHLAVVFNLPVQNIGVYFTKLYSIMVLMMCLGSVIEYSIYWIGNSSRDVRKYCSLVFLTLMFIVRVFIALLFYLPNKASLYYYLALTADGLTLGSFKMSFLPLVPKYSTVVTLSFYMSAVYVFIVQNTVDMFLYHNPLMNIKMQTWLCAITTCLSVFIWGYYILKYDRNETKAGKIEQDSTQPKITKTGLEHYIASLSQFNMIGVASLFSCFFYPGVLPYAVLERDKCHSVNLLGRVVGVIGPFILVLIDNYVDDFKRWRRIHDSAWLLVVPILIIAILTLMAIHTRIRYSRGIINSQIAVLTMTSVLMFSCIFMACFSTIGVGYYVYWVSEDREGSTFLITTHTFLVHCYLFLFSKLSVGYNDTRVSLGYTLPRFRPRHRMSKWNLFWYFVRNTFRRALSDIVNDFRMNIRKYL